jgi:hypothetical protein
MGMECGRDGLWWVGLVATLVFKLRLAVVARMGVVGSCTVVRLVR